MSNKHKSILLKDDTSGRMYLAWAFIEALVRTGYLLFLEQNKYDQYGEFLKLFPTVSVKNPQKECDLHIIFTENNVKIQIPNVMYYPIVTSLEYENRIKLDNYIPITFSAVKKNNYYQPDLHNALDYIEKHFGDQDFSGKKVLISAGPTAEDIDPVRFLTNRSTGKMGIALARVAFIRGADVCLVLGPIPKEHPGYLNAINVRNAQQMYQAVIDNVTWCDYFFSTAAVADYAPIKVHSNKLKKGKGNLLLEMNRTKDILQEIQKKDEQRIIGFSVETTNLINNSREKLQRKNLDMIVANNPTNPGAGFAVDTNQVEIITAHNHISLPLLSKKETAFKILDFLKEMDQ